MRNGKELNETNRLAALSPFVDQADILRVGGRLGEINIAPESKHPLILPREHHVTKTIVDWIHRRNGHVGPEHVLLIVREKYWILTARIVINQVISNCLLCRIRKAKTRFPFMANLPPCRAAIGEPPLVIVVVIYLDQLQSSMDAKD